MKLLAGVLRQAKRAAGSGVTRRRALIGVGLLVVVSAACFTLVVWRASGLAKELLGIWATAAVTEASNGAYRLHVGRVRLSWALRSVTLDSAHLTTVTEINSRRPQPLAEARLTLAGCTVKGLHLFALARGGGLIATSFGCRSVDAASVVTIRAPEGAPEEPQPDSVLVKPRRGRFLVLQRDLALPRSVPRIRIDRIDFPHTTLDFRLDRPRVGPAIIKLDRLRWTLSDLLIDPSDPEAGGRPLFSRTVEIAAADFVAYPDSTRTVSVGTLLASLTDSTIELRDVSFAPAVSGAELARRRPFRRDRIRTTASRIAAQGIDVGSFALGAGVHARRLQIDSVHLEVTSDKRRPRRPGRPIRLTPQQWIADLDGTVNIDTVLVTGELVYREHQPGRDHPGVLTFARLNAVAANVRHIAKRQSSTDIMTITVSAYLQNVARLEAEFLIPLDAPRFEMSYRGTLGSMDATALNSFIVPTQAVRIESGRTTGIRFGAVVRDGVARGTVTPIYQELSISVIRSGRSGLLGSGGVLGGAARGLASFFANETIVKNDNPDDPTKAARVGVIYRVRRPDEKLPGFLWEGLRDGLLSVIKK